MGGKMEAAATWEAIDSLTPWDKNPRKNDHAVQTVADSIRRFGFGSPILARAADRVVIGGHTRLKAAQKLGLDKVPVRFLDLDPAEAAALALADNKLGELAEWDDEAVAEILGELEQQGTPIDGLGWDDDALKALLGDGIEAAPPSDDAPEIDEEGEPDSTAGTVYQLGPHRLVCGDSTKTETWSSLLGDERLQMVWTDPPYGVSNVSGVKDPRHKNHGKGDRIENDDLSAIGLRDLLDASLGLCCNNSKQGAAWYVAAPAKPLQNSVFVEVLLKLGIWRSSLVWMKDHFVFGRGDYHYRHEPIFYGWTPGAAHYFTNDRTQDTILAFPNPKGGGKGLPEHPTMKPIPLVVKCIENSSKPGWIVGEPFGGSGTTLMACAQTGRVARVIELDPRYCDVIRRRWTMWATANGIDPGPGALAPREVSDVD
jgi:DNA modification methylase